ncbi:MAG: hypothetical protein ABSD41_01390 [Candidatus Bathyarchaeia archaeon]
MQEKLIKRVRITNEKSKPNASTETLVFQPAPQYLSSPSQNPAKDNSILEKYSDQEIS